MKSKDDGGIGIPYSEVAPSEVMYEPAKKLVTLDTWTPPEWIKEVAIRVDELIQDPHVLEVFREEIKSLRAEWEERGQFEAFVPFPVRAVSKAHKIAVLAAVRDRVMQHEADRASNFGFAIQPFEPIDPWRVDENEKDDDVRFAALKDGMYYGGLTWRVIQFGARDKKKLLGWLSDIEADLARMASNPEATGSTPGARAMDGDSSQGELACNKNRKKIRKAKKKATPMRRSEPNHNDMRIYAAYLETGTYRKAAEKLGLSSHSYVGKVVRSMKASLKHNVRSVQAGKLPEDKRGGIQFPAS